MDIVFVVTPRGVIAVVAVAFLLIIFGSVWMAEWRQRVRRKTGRK